MRRGSSSPRALRLYRPRSGDAWPPGATIIDTADCAPIATVITMNYLPRKPGNLRAPCMYFTTEKFARIPRGVGLPLHEATPPPARRQPRAGPWVWMPAGALTVAGALLL